MSRAEDTRTLKSTRALQSMMFAVRAIGAEAEAAGASAAAAASAATAERAKVLDMVGSRFEVDGTVWPPSGQARIPGGALGERPGGTLAPMQDGVGIRSEYVSPRE